VQLLFILHIEKKGQDPGKGLIECKVSIFGKWDVAVFVVHMSACDEQLIVVWGELRTG